MENLSEMSDAEADRLDTAWDLTTSSRLGCQAVIQGDVTVEFPMYTRNYVQEGGAIQLGKSDQKDERESGGAAMNWTDAEDIGIALFEAFPAVDPLTVRFTDLREKVLALGGSRAIRRPRTSPSSRPSRWPGTKSGKTISSRVS
jgi:2Fe-2S ferredoxin